MKIEFSHADLVKVLELINEYKIKNKDFDSDLLNTVTNKLRSYRLPEFNTIDKESYLESLFNWPIRRLFTYGTLMPGQVNSIVFKSTNGEWEDAYTKGNLCHTGWGIEHGYPALQWNPDSGSIVNGKILNSGELDWKKLDELEGDEYTRIWVTTRVDDRRIVVANCYTVVEHK